MKKLIEKIVRNNNKSERHKPYVRLRPAKIEDAEALMFLVLTDFMVAPLIGKPEISQFPILRLKK